MRATELVAAAALATGCATAPVKPVETAAGVTTGPLTVASQSLTGFQVALKLTVTNPTSEDWTVTGATDALSVDGKTQPEDHPELDQTVAAGGSATVEVDASAEPIHDEAGLRAWIARGDQPIPLLIQGQLALKSGATTRALAFSRAGELRAPRFPVPKMDDAEVARYEGGSIAVSFFLGLQNENAFPVKIKSIRYTATLAGRQVADGLASAADTLPASQLAEYEIDKQLDSTEGGEQITKLAEGGKLDYALDGTVDLGIAQIPIHLTGFLSFDSKPSGHHKKKNDETSGG